MIAYIASQRTKEIGIRIALGAVSRDVTGCSCARACCWPAPGLRSGCWPPAPRRALMSTLLYGVSALDPLTYVAVATGLGLTALLASYVPAARAARVDPAEALRRDV